MRFNQVCGWLAEKWMRSSRVWMRSSRVWMSSSRVWMRSSRLLMRCSRIWIRFSHVVRASDCLEKKWSVSLTTVFYFCNLFITCLCTVHLYLLLNKYAAKANFTTASILRHSGIWGRQMKQWWTKWTKMANVFVLPKFLSTPQTPPPPPEPLRLLQAFTR